MPLKIEVYAEDKWIELSTLNPCDLPGSISDVRLDGRRDIYIFRCKADDSLSTIYSSVLGMDVANERIREIHSAGQELVKALGKGDEPYEMSVKTERSPEPRKIRFTHI